MAITLAFDVYGTMIDTTGVIKALERVVGDKAPAFSQAWRDKQLEYSFRRGLMQNYVDFSLCTRQALEYTCQFIGVDLDAAAKDGLMGEYRVLPAFPDVDEGLSKLKSAGRRLFAFSNGSAAAVNGLLENAKIDGHFDGVVSVEDVRSFKPNPGVYAHFLRKSESTGAEAWMISGNTFDVIGALSAGMRAAWVKRSPNAIYDPWELEPTITVSGILDLYEKLCA